MVLSKRFVYPTRLTNHEVLRVLAYIGNTFTARLAAMRKGGKKCSDHI